MPLNPAPMTTTLMGLYSSMQNSAGLYVLDVSFSELWKLPGMLCGSRGLVEGSQLR